MEIPEFVDSRRVKWQALERLLDQSQAGGLKRLSLDDARHLSRLYRSASSDLLWIRAHGGSAEVTEYLNDLVGRAYAITYPGRKPRPRDAWTFVLRGFPSLLFSEWRAFAAAWLIFLAGFGFGYLGMVVDPSGAYFLVPESHLKVDPNERAREEADKEVASIQDQAAFTAMLWRNNIQVSFLCFALGITAGVGTALLLFGNGVLLGALAWVYASKGMTAWFWAWILPHGIPEITAIAIGGAAGFVVARGILAPGGMPRRVALRREGIVAVRLVLGGVLLFLLAGIIEGTISQIHPPKIPAWFKIGFALVVGLGVYAYLFSAALRRNSSARPLEGATGPNRNRQARGASN